MTIWLKMNDDALLARCSMNRKGEHLRAKIDAAKIAPHEAFLALSEIPLGQTQKRPGKTGPFEFCLALPIPGETARDFIRSI